MLEKKNKHNMKKKLMLISCAAFGCTNRQENSIEYTNKKIFFHVQG